jgi:glycosyltransferase involved in cell wall biosynthesis
MSIQVLSITTNLSRYGGAQKVLMDVHEGIREQYNAKVIGFQKFEELHSKYNIQKTEYVQLVNPFYLNNKVLIVHARNVMAVMMLMKRLFFLNTEILYVSHNVYSTHRRYSFFPKRIISISKKVTQNLTDYFKLTDRNIQLIYNGIKDEAKGVSMHSYRKSGKIIILYSARVNTVKRQLQIVDKLDGVLDSTIEIHFAGVGDDYEKLKKRCEGTSNFKTLGFVKDISQVINKADYLMLFSVQEGLPISLIEGIMHGKPLLVNDVGGNQEIGVPGVNGIPLDEDWDSLANTLNGLTAITSDQYGLMSQESRKRYENIFTYERMVKGYLEVLKAIA